MNIIDDIDINEFCHISTCAILNGMFRYSKFFVDSGTIISKGLLIPTNTIIVARKRIIVWTPL